MEIPLRADLAPDIRLIETFGFWPGRGVPDLSLHLDRMAGSAQALGYAFDRARAETIAGLFHDGPLRCRLTLGVAGDLDLTTAPLPPVPPLWRVRIAQTRLVSTDPWLRVKSTARAVYDHARATLPVGIDEWLFLNENGALCEGTITNLFVETADGRRRTPALSAGVLPGILRQRLLADRWEESVLVPDDLGEARAVFMGNALRGLIPVQMDWA